MKSTPLSDNAMFGDPNKVINLRFHIYRDTQGGYRWRLKAPNNRTIADSGEAYRRKRDCKAAITLIQLQGEFAKVIDNTLSKTPKARA